MPYRYLDLTTEQLIAERSDVHFFCVCGRHLRLGPEDFAKWPGSSLHRLAARLRCSACGAMGDIPEVRLTAASARGGTSGKGGQPDTTDVTRGTPVHTTHPRTRSRRTGYCDGRKLLKAPKPLTGKAYKDALLPRAREIARTGRYERWLDVVLQFESWEQDALRAWLTDSEKDELEMIAQGARRFRRSPPPCCPAGAIGAH